MERSSRSSSFCGCDGHSTESSFLDQPSVVGAEEIATDHGETRMERTSVSFVCGKHGRCDALPRPRDGEGVVQHPRLRLHGQTASPIRSLLQHIRYSVHTYPPKYNYHKYIYTYVHTTNQKTALENTPNFQKDFICFAQFFF